jgi:hypothetical protein
MLRDLAASWAWYKGETRPQPEDVSIDGILLTVGMRLRWFFRFSKTYGCLDSIGHFNLLPHTEPARTISRLPCTETSHRDKVNALLDLSDLDKGYELGAQSTCAV